MLCYMLKLIMVTGICSFQFVVYWCVLIGRCKNKESRFCKLFLSLTVEPGFMQPQPRKKTSDTSTVKKPSLYWCEAVPSKSGSKRLKTVSAQTDQTGVSPHPAGSSGGGIYKVILGADVRIAAPKKWEGFHRKYKKTSLYSKPRSLLLLEHYSSTRTFSGR